MKKITSQLDWQKNRGLIPAIIQNSTSKQVLMLGYMNQASLQKTLQTGYVWFWSRSKQSLWRKGETSGNTLKFESIAVDCDGDTLLIKAIPIGPTCHTGDVSCFNNEREINPVEELFTIIASRKENMPTDSYTASLLREGLEKICDKIDEEAAEVIQAAKNEGKRRLIEESVDLIYHLFVLLASKNIDIDDIYQEMRKRMK